tara:strand:- start:14387 stop:15547 length:1161 start_codon:yes stop_codon:yes gene_type:complete
MHELKEIMEKIEDEITEVRGKASGKPWGAFSRRAFIYNLETVVPGLEELHSLFQLARNEIEKKAEANRFDVGSHLKELNQLITVLKRNKELEHARVEKAKRQNIHEMADTITVPELYSDLEQKTLGILLKSNYLVERIRVFERKHEPIMKTKGAQRNVLDILEKREDELADLRKKYEETRKNSFLGLVEKESSIETEAELNKLSRSLEGKTALMKKAFEDMREDFESYQRKMQEAESKINSVEEIESQITGKTFELITMLKKERDYVKKVLIEIEQDTIQLRNTYSKELLGLQEEKINLKNSLEEKYEKETKELKAELHEKNKLIHHFQETVSRKEKKLHSLEDNLDSLELINKALQKHDKMKKKILKHENKKPKNKRKKSSKKKK